MDITLTITEEQDKELRKMGIAQFGLDADCTAKDALEFIVKNNTDARMHEELDNKFRKLDITAKRNLIDMYEKE